MIGRRYILISLAVLTPILIIVGCVKRKETITVKPDGAVTVAIEYEGDKADFEKGDAMPSPASGWKVSREVEQKEDNKQEVKLTGERTFHAREELPGSYAAPSDPDAGTYLKFPTTLTREQRKDGVYLTFRRVYVPREWAYVQFWADHIIDDDVKELGEKKAEELSLEERAELLQAFARVEAHKQIELAQRAVKDADDKLKPDHWLLARQALLKVYQEGIDWNEVAQRVESLSSEDRERFFEREATRIMEEAHRAFTASLKRDAGYDDDGLARFEAAYQRARKFYEVTNQLGGHAFEIEVDMPGTIVAHNGDKEEDGTVQWEFEGSAFRDRPYELLVTSRLPLDRSEK